MQRQSEYQHGNQEQPQGGQPGNQEGTPEGSEGGGDATITLTEKELRSQIDQAVTKALGTRDKKLQDLQTQIQQKNTQIEELNRMKEEEGTDVEQRLQKREQELSQLKTAMQSEQTRAQELETRIQEIVDQELDALTTEDRRIVEAALPEDLPAVSKLQVLRGLKNAGRIGQAHAPDRPGGIGRPTNIGRGGDGAGEGQPSAADRDFEEGRRAAGQGSQEEEGYVPPGWRE